MSRASKTLSAVVAAVMLFVLSGCVVFEMDFAVDADLRVSGTAKVAIEVAELEGTGMSPQELLGEIEDEFSADDLPPGATMTPIDDGELYGFEVEYDKVDQADVDFEAGGIAMFTQDGDTIVFNIEHPFFEEETDVDPDDPFGGMMSPSAMLTTGHMAITFPGEIIEAPGATIKGNTATWDLKTFSEPYVTARASVVSGNSSPDGTADDEDAGGESTDAAGAGADGTESTDQAIAPNQPGNAEQEQSAGAEMKLLIFALIAVAALAAIALIAALVALRKRKKGGGPGGTGAPMPGFAAPGAGSAPHGYAPHNPHHGQPVAPHYVQQPQVPQSGQQQAPPYGQPYDSENRPQY